MKSSTSKASSRRHSIGSDLIGFLGVALAVAGLSDMPILPRLILLLASSACMPVSFFSRNDWPIWVRWWLSFAANAFLALAAWSFILKSGAMRR